MVDVGVLWDKEVEWDREKPFDYATNETYEYFSDLASESGVRLFIAKYTWYVDGKLEKAWKYDGGWKRVECVELDAVHDKFKTNEETLRLKKVINNSVGIINRPELEVLCKDKLKTFESFSEYIPETRRASEENIFEMRQIHDKIVLKPRMAYGAEGIHILDEEDGVPELEEDEYIVQRFVDSSGGVDGLVDGSHDLRAIVVNGRICGAYVRYNEDSEISNVSEGGTKEAVELESFPEEARDIVEEVVQELDYHPYIISVDLFFDSSGNPWIVELNSKPGLNFFADEDVKRQITPVMRELIDAYPLIGRE